MQRLMINCICHVQIALVFEYLIGSNNVLYFGKTKIWTYEKLRPTKFYADKNLGSYMKSLYKVAFDLYTCFFLASMAKYFCYFLLFLKKIKYLKTRERIMNFIPDNIFHLWKFHFRWRNHLEEKKVEKIFQTLKADSKVWDNFW